jgi:hypothetical protein
MFQDEAADDGIEGRKGLQGGGGGGLTDNGQVGKRCGRMRKYLSSNLSSRML